MELLALIGLIVILWFAAKGIKRLGTFVCQIEDSLAMHQASFKRGGVWVNKDVQKIREKVHAVKGEGSDHEYADRVRKEIDELTN